MKYQLYMHVCFLFIKLGWVVLRLKPSALLGDIFTVMSRFLPVSKGAMKPL